METKIVLKKNDRALAGNNAYDGPGTLTVTWEPFTEQRVAVKQRRARGAGDSYKALQRNDVVGRRYSITGGRCYGRRSNDKADHEERRSGGQDGAYISYRYERGWEMKRSTDERRKNLRTYNLSLDPRIQALERRKPK